MNTLLAQVTVTTSSSGDLSSISPIWYVVELAIVAIFVVAAWKVFTKAGQPGWAALIPIYNMVTLFRITGKSGWLILAMFVPFWSLYIAVRLVFNLASVFGRGIGFGFGLLFLFPIFLLILAFGNSEYVGPNGKRQAQFPTGGPTPLPIAA